MRRNLLHAARPILESFYKEEAIQLNFTRVKHFNNRVLWLEAEEDGTLYCIPSTQCS